MTLPLQGITVLDLCVVLAGPTCGRTLAQYGANVIKVDPRHRKPSVTPWIDVGRGKKSIALNIKNPGGLETLLRMVENSDVFIEGFRKGVAGRLGIGYQDLRKHAPDIIYGSINCFGHEGKWSNRPGFEQNAQAATGVQVRNGGKNGKPRPASFTLNDYGTGLSAAYGLMLAILEKQKTGKGQHVKASLAHTSAIISAPQHVSYKKLSRSENGGPASRGKHLLCRLYQCTDGWIFIHIPGESALHTFISIPSINIIFKRLHQINYDHLINNNEGIEEELEQLFFAHSTNYWLKTLSDKNLLAVRNTYADDIHKNQWNRNRGMIVETDYSNDPNKHLWEKVTWPGNPVQMSRFKLPNMEPPSFAFDTDSVLKEFNFTESEILSLKESGTI